MVSDQSEKWQAVLRQNPIPRSLYLHFAAQGLHLRQVLHQCSCSANFFPVRRGNASAGRGYHLTVRKRLRTKREQRLSARRMFAMLEKRMGLADAHR